jgi:DNA-binding beta-propeller fold protein YncE
VTKEITMDKRSDPVHLNPRVWPRRCGALLVLLAAWAVGSASPPPAPDELKYPNIIKPQAQFGTFGDGRDQFNEPLGLDFGGDASIYVADVHNHRVVQRNLQGENLRTWGTLGSQPGQFKFPHALAVDRATGEVVVADTGNRRLQVFAPDGTLRRVLGSPPSHGFVSLSAVAAHAGRIVASDDATNQVHLFEADGKHKVFGGTGTQDGLFDRPADVSLDAAGQIYVADSYNNRIQKFDAHGRHLKSWGGWGSHAGFLANPSGARVHGNKLYVADLINHRVQVFSTDGEFLYQWGRHPVIAHEGHGRLHYPQRLAVSPDGQRTVVCEPFEYRCQVFRNDTGQSVAHVDDSAWWDKATRFHYGSSAEVSPTMVAIAEPDTHSVLLFENTDQPRLLTKLGGQGREPGKFVRPSGMYLDEERGEVLVSDSGNHRLQLFRLQRRADQKGFVPNAATLVKTVSMLGIAPKPQGSPAAPIEPSTIARGKDGLYYIADPHNSRILVLDKNFALVRTIGKYGNGPGQLLVPSKMRFSPDGNTLYVVDTYNFRIQAFDRMGTFLFQWGGPGIGAGQFMHAFGIGVDKDGAVYIGDDGANRIQKFDAKGKFLLKWGKWGTEPGQFYKPKGVAVDERGRIFVMNFGNHRGEVFDTSGKFLYMFGIADGYTTPVAASEQNLRDRPSNGGTYLLNYRTQPATIPLNQLFDIEVRVVDAKFRDPPPDDVVLSADAGMPAHNHGMNVTPQVEKLGKGVWRVKGLSFHMPGYWRLSLDLARGKVTERADFDVHVAP